MRIGVDIGGTNLRVGVVDDVSLVYEKRFHADFASLCKSQTPDVAWAEIVRITSNAIQEAISAYPGASFVGIGFPGFIDPVTNNVAQSPNLPGLSNVNLGQAVSQSINLPVIVENDALAAAYGEYRLLKAKGQVAEASLIYLGLGTGVGGGLVYADRPFPGLHGVAMEVGHIIIEPGGRLCGCGNRGCMEQYASASGVVHSFESSTGKRLDTHQIADLAESGNMEAILAFELAANALAQALAHILKIVDIGQVVIGGGLSQAWPLMQYVFRQRLDADLIPVLRGKIDIRISGSGDQAGIIGAALLSSGERSGI